MLHVIHTAQQMTYGGGGGGGGGFTLYTKYWKACYVTLCAGNIKGGVVNRQLG